VPPAGYQIVPGIVDPDPEIIDNILRTTDLRNAHAADIASVVQDGNYAGIAVDYRGVSPTLKEQFTQFIETLSGALHDDGRTLTLTLPMPAIQGSDVDAGAYDWERLGSAADTVVLAGELDQELYFQRTEAALDYAVDKIDRGKLLITVSSLSVERGGDGLRTMPLGEALTLASTVSLGSDNEIVAGSQVPLIAQNLSQEDGASGMAWDDTARAVTFSYPGRGGKRTVWVANAFSAAFRLELAQRYGIGGIAVSSVAVEDGGADVWAPIRELADTGNLQLVKPNTDRFAPEWSAAGGQLSSTSGGSVTWTAPTDPGTYDVTLIVSDGVVRAGQKVSLEVAEAPAATTPE
jgi:spore germination protein YaaH